MSRTRPDGGDSELSLPIVDELVEFVFVIVFQSLRTGVPRNGSKIGIRDLHRTRGSFDDDFNLKLVRAYFAQPWKVLPLQASRLWTALREWTGFVIAKIVFIFSIEGNQSHGLYTTSG
jgi:hypothetical protein